MQNAASSRIAWVDHAKGLSIILVVMMHSTLGVELALGSHSFMGDVVAFAAAFRMPLFFMISGLFLARALERPWARYLDDKVLHFAYFYVLWSLIQIGIRLAVPNEGNHGVSLHDLLMIPLEPYGTIWFIYVLAVFFVVTRLLAAAGPAVLLGLAVVLNILPVETGSIVIDQFADRWVYFVVGYLFSGRIFDMAATAARFPARTLAAAGIFSAANIALLTVDAADAPGVGLVLGLSGAAAVIGLVSIAARHEVLRVLAWCGQHSLYIYLGFFLPMAVMRIGLIRLGLVPEINLFAILVTAAAVIGPLVTYYMVRRTPLAFLFTRPETLRLPALQRLFLRRAPAGQPGS